MIYSEVFDLQEYITSTCKVMCEIGNRNLGEDEYPSVKIVPDLEFNIYYANSRMDTIDFPITLKIIVRKTEEIKALEVLENLIKKLNQYNNEKGHKFSEDRHTPEYNDDTKTYEISLIYILKLIIQDT